MSTERLLSLLRRLENIPKLSAVLLFIFFFGSITVYWFSWETRVALIPGLTLMNFYWWNLMTCSLVDIYLWRMTLFLLPLGFLYSLLENNWDSVPFLIFWSFASIFSSVFTVLVSYLFYLMTRNEMILYAPLCGSVAVFSSVLVAIKQLIPNHEIYLSPRGFQVHILVNDLPFWFISSWFFSWIMNWCWLGDFLLALSGLIGAWIYLRFLQKREQGRGDASDTFQWETFLPFALRQWLFRLFSFLSIVPKNRNRNENNNLMSEDNRIGMSVTHTTTTDPMEAERRRQRALRIVEERLGQWKSNTVEDLV